MSESKVDKSNDQARKQLRKFKEMYELTWPQVAEVIGRSLSAIEVWYQNKKNIPEPCKILVNTYLDNPQVLKERVATTLNR